MNRSANGTKINENKKIGPMLSTIFEELRPISSKFELNWGGKSSKFHQKNKNYVGKISKLEKLESIAYMDFEFAGKVILNKGIMHKICIALMTPQRAFIEEDLIWNFRI